MRIIHIVDSAGQINFGIWNTILTAAETFSKKGISTELWSPGSLEVESEFVTNVSVDSTSIRTLKKLIYNRGLNTETDVVFSHGTWSFPTRWAGFLKKKGYKWMYIPHGMLEPWPMKQKWLKKKIYYKLVEQRIVRAADLIRAVSAPEQQNLRKLFPIDKVVFVPNGVETDFSVPELHHENILRYLFLSRLHPKKNVISLLKAWESSFLSRNDKVELVIAGPDQGELKHVKEFSARIQNIRYVGGVYGADKQVLFASSTFYVLPSFSEGLPSSLLEAMCHGLIPLVTLDCNLPEVATLQLGAIIGHDSDSIRDSIESAYSIPPEIVNEKGRACHSFIVENFSTDHIVNQLTSLLFQKGRTIVQHT